jgi:hypothetical protein
VWRLAEGPAQTEVFGAEDTLRWQPVAVAMDLVVGDVVVEEH